MQRTYRRDLRQSTFTSEGWTAILRDPCLANRCPSIVGNDDNGHPITLFFERSRSILGVVRENQDTGEQVLKSHHLDSGHLLWSRPLVRSLCRGMLRAEGVTNPQHYTHALGCVEWLAEHLGWWEAQ